MEEHVFIAFSVSGSFKVAGTTALDLNTAFGFLLNVLHIRTAMTDNLRTKVEPWDGFEINGDSLLGPFSLNERMGSAFPFKT